MDIEIIKLIVQVIATLGMGTVIGGIVSRKIAKSENQRDKKAEVKYAKFQKESSVKQQETYLELADEIEEKAPRIHVIRIDTCIGLEGVKEKVLESLGVEGKK